MNPILILLFRLYTASQGYCPAEPYIHEFHILSFGFLLFRSFVCFFLYYQAKSYLPLIKFSILIP